MLSIRTCPYLHAFVAEVIRSIRLWNILLAAQLVEQYKRQEVRVITDANCPQKPDPMPSLFRARLNTKSRELHMNY